jgi:Protein of unknown function (DUF2459)
MGPTSPVRATPIEWDRKRFRSIGICGNASSLICAPQRALASSRPGQEEMIFNRPRSAEGTPAAGPTRASADAMSCQAPRHAVARRALLRASLAVSTSWILPGCRSTPLPTYQEAPQEAPRDGVTIYVIAAGWHTEIALPMHAIRDPLKAVTPDFPGAQYLSFGWGERNYYMARAPTLGDAMSALFPGPAVLLVTPLYSPPRDSRANAQVFEVSLSAAGLDRLSNHLWAAFDKSGDGTPRRLAAGPEPGSVFYAATGTYSSNYTCNTWIAESLRVGGIPVTPAGVVFAGQLTDQLRSLNARAAEAP